MKRLILTICLVCCAASIPPPNAPNVIHWSVPGYDLSTATGWTVEIRTTIPKVDTEKALRWALDNTSTAVLASVRVPTNDIPQSWSWPTNGNQWTLVTNVPASQGSFTMPTPGLYILRLIPPFKVNNSNWPSAWAIHQ